MLSQLLRAEIAFEEGTYVRPECASVARFLAARPGVSFEVPADWFKFKLFSTAIWSKSSQNANAQPANHASPDPPRTRNARTTCYFEVVT